MTTDPSESSTSDNSSEESKTKEAVKTLKSLNYEDFKNIGKIPCARQSFLYGIMAGAVVGGIRYFYKGNVSSASNWAVGSFLLSSIGIWETCRLKKRREYTQFKTIVEEARETRKIKIDESVEKDKLNQLEKET
ncbi:hypothetical protein G9A89_005873 [Geosiphon pyriformis]|nr:hypothetical protein G9A89_005873 [Geosiphon pyriformis]